MRRRKRDAAPAPYLDAESRVHPGLKRLTPDQVNQWFPGAKVIEEEVNKRYADIAGKGISGRRLYWVMRNLGNTDPQAFLDFLDRRGYEVLSHWGGYFHFPELARECARLVAAQAKGAGA